MIDVPHKHWEASVFTRKDYWEFSQECARIADEVPSADQRESLLRMAQAWLQLATGERSDEEYDIDTDTPH